MAAGIDSVRLWDSVEALARFTAPDLPWTRRSFSPLYLHSRAWLADQFRSAGLQVHTDAGGNLCGVLPGRNPAAGALVTGSHTDTVNGGGRYDGIIGVLAGLEIARSLNDSGTRLEHSFEVIDFLAEEPSEYGVSCVGSRAIAGTLDTTMLTQRAPDGETLADGITRCGGIPANLARPLRERGDITAYVELHIEQGPVLEAAQLPIGVVTHIVGIRRFRICVHGRADHAGTTPMDIRCDALVGAARVIDAAYVEAARLSGQPHYVVATVGRINVTPNAANAVPALAELTLEVRSDSDAVLNDFADQLLARVKPSLDALRVSVTSEELSRTRPTQCATPLMQAIESASSSLGLASRRLPSGAGHDGVQIARIAPVAMIFIPCAAGRSHCPEESITQTQLAAGANVLLQTLLTLDRQTSP